MLSSLALVPGVDDALASAILRRLETVETRLREVVTTTDELAGWTSRHLMDAGGKRVRPLLALLAASFGDIERPGVIDAAVVVELTHLATLYHDDVMDDAPTRRGARTAHEIWGNSVAILTGDFLLARASALSSELGPETVRIHARTFERLCMGQLAETVGPGPDQDPFAHYLHVLGEKTASLIATAGELGALQAGAGPAIAGTMKAYGERVGVAFQLADDVLDLRSEGSASGKTPGTDLREGVPTMPLLLLRRRVAAEGADARTTELLRLLDGDLGEDAALHRAVELLREDPALAETERLARRMADESLGILEELPDRPARAALAAFTESLIARES